MNTIEYIKLSLEISRGWAMGLIADMQEMPLVQPTAKGGNHPLWVLGHIVWAESNLLDCFIQGKPNRFPDVELKFGMGTTPSTDASQYPSMDELMSKFEEIRAASLAYLDTMSEEDLERPSNAPEEFGPGFAKVAGCFTAMTIHPIFHAGQVADARLVAGKQPLLG